VLTPGQVIQIGRPPNRVDLLTSIDGVQWEEVWDSKIEVELSGLKCWVIGKELLIKKNGIRTSSGFGGRNEVENCNLSAPALIPIPGLLTHCQAARTFLAHV